MKKIAYRSIITLIILIVVKVVIGLAPMCPSRYYTEKTFNNLLQEVENNNTVLLKKIIFYCIDNYDTEKEKKYNLELLRCYTYKLNTYKKIEYIFQRQLYLKKYSEKQCPKEPLKLLNGHHSIVKYFFDTLIFNQFPK